MRRCEKHREIRQDIRKKLNTTTGPQIFFKSNLKVSFRMANTEERSQIFPILLVNFMESWGFSIVLPFLVFLVKDFGGNAIAYNL